MLCTCTPIVLCQLDHWETRGCRLHQLDHWENYEYLHKILFFIFIFGCQSVRHRTAQASTPILKFTGIYTNHVFVYEHEVLDWIVGLDFFFFFFF